MVHFPLGVGSGPEKVCGINLVSIRNPKPELLLWTLFEEFTTASKLHTSLTRPPTPAPAPAPVPAKAPAKAPEPAPAPTPAPVPAPAASRKRGRHDAADDDSQLPAHKKLAMGETPEYPELSDPASLYVQGQEAIFGMRAPQDDDDYEMEEESDAEEGEL
ncbi:hypothetical protein N7537_008773 [Penicillium hordei]|uniref:Uncharacterized protein n=1 Tax=Penicillium hordei TaxID=40994 RepID=A0AAD6E112_9EURO|nr:uncharacterized protein N7537_008773 [Penicillium hordei]KAJ5598689.1 hypothetical protein N7537_008773 [Penicillium hordei]